MTNSTEAEWHVVGGAKGHYEEEVPSVSSMIAASGFFTEEALQGIASTTVANLTAFERDGEPLHEVAADGAR